MRTAIRTAVLTTAILLASVTGAAAQPQYLTLRGGVFDVSDNHESGAFGVEYRGTPFWYNLLPIAGVEVTTDASVYAYGGIAYDVNLGDSWVVTPSFAVSAYEEGDDGRDLGGVIEFRSGIELDYRFANEHRLGVSLHHLSNAGIYDSNPGTEILSLNYSIPFGQ